MPGLTALVPLDGTKLSESAFALLPVIKTLGFTKLRLVGVWDNVWSDREALVNRPEGEREELAEKGRAYLEAYLSQHVPEVKKAGLEAEIMVRAGRAAEEVLLVAQDADLILIATHGRSGIARWRLGSVADKIVREAPCPVLVIKHSTPDATLTAVLIVFGVAVVLVLPALGFLYTLTQRSMLEGEFERPRSATGS